MRNKIIIIACIAILTGCRNADKLTKNVKAPTSTRQSSVNVSLTEAKPFIKFREFWDYYSANIMLNENFIAYDRNHDRISKTEFFKSLANGSYQPIRINPTDSIRYQLKSAPKHAESSIAVYMKLFAEQELAFYKMEGKPIPKFDFTTIEGARYTNENTRGKILLFKCWFIACVPCAEEMPQLNELVQKYKGRRDVIFLSLAIDDKAPLIAHLKKTKFDYQTVAAQEEYMSGKLHVTGYPTHFLIDKAGNLSKVAHSADEVELFLSRLDKNH